MTPSRIHSPARQSGFTLIELMVGVVLGMLAILSIAQVMVMSEGGKRAVTSGADAQISGALSLFALQREVGMAGYGFSAIQASLGCAVNYRADPAGADSFTLAPVVIGNGDDGSNTITVLRSTKTSFSVPMRLTTAHPTGSASFTVESAFGTAAGDLFVAMPTDITTSNCQVFQASAAPLNNIIQHAATSTFPWNVGSGTANGFTADSYLLNMGGLSLQRFSVNSSTRSLQISQLTSASGAWSAAQDVQPQVVMLKALYGKDTNADNTVDTYNTTTPTTNAEWTQVLSIRVLVIARSAEPVKHDEADPTPATLQWDVGTDNVAGSATCHGDRKCIAIDLSPLGTDYRRYRYKLYDTIIPLRNMLWKA